MFSWIFLGLVIGLVVWAAWRQRRYGGTTSYDRDATQADLGLHHSAYNPWGLGRHAGEQEDSS